MIEVSNIEKSFGTYSKAFFRARVFKTGKVACLLISGTGSDNNISVHADLNQLDIETHRLRRFWFTHQRQSGRSAESSGCCSGTNLQLIP
jgi:hypothetical protein